MKIARGIRMLTTRGLLRLGTKVRSRRKTSGRRRSTLEALVINGVDVFLNVRAKVLCETDAKRERQLPSPRAVVHHALTNNTHLETVRIFTGLDVQITALTPA